MNKHKPDPKIIRKNDRVKIINPEVFVRCGYPLCKKDLKENIYKNYGKIVEDLIYSVAKGDTLINNVSNSLDFNVDFNNNKIIDILASIQLVAKKFGGNERKIFTQRYDNLKDKICYVSSIRFVKTGNYVSGSSYGGYDGEDYDPPYLKNEKTHKVLSLDVCRKEIDESFNNKIIKVLPNKLPTWVEYELIEIEAINVEKLPDDREFVQDDNGNFIENEMYLL